MTPSAIYMVPKFPLGWDLVVSGLGLNFDMAGINGVMSHVLVSSAKVKRVSGSNKWLWQTLDTCNVLGPTFGFQIHSNFNLRNKHYQFFFVTLRISIFLHKDKFSLHFSKCGAKSLK